MFNTNHGCVYRAHKLLLMLSIIVRVVENKFPVYMGGLPIMVETYGVRSSFLHWPQNKVVASFGSLNSMF